MTIFVIIVANNYVRLNRDNVMLSMIDYNINKM